jgi:hypothetical protein
MGYGSYSYAAHQAITSARQKMPAQAVFARKECHPLMNPRGIKRRESNDSAGHPNTVPIIFALDVSGSMGEVPEKIARHELPTLMKTLLDAGVADPQVLFMAFQDAAGPDAPLQVGQFESTAELMDQWLTWTWLIGGGYSEYESYDLAMWFAAHKTRIDSYDERGKKGYFFMSGDEPCYPQLFASFVDTVIGEKLPGDLPLANVVADLRKMYHPFFLIPDPGRGGVAPFWRAHFGEAAMVLGAPEDVCAVAAGAIAIHEGVLPSLDALAKTLAQHMKADRIDRIRSAMKAWAKSIGKD